MATWEEQKRAGQTAFTLAGNLFQDVHSSVGDVYQQILTTGRIYVPGNASLTQQIAEGKFPEPEHDTGWFGAKHSIEPVHDQDQDIEPEGR